VRVNVNGRQLARALKLGLSDLYVFGEESPIAWHSENSTYVSAPLSKDAAVEPAADALRIESPVVAETVSPPLKPKPERNPVPVSESINNTNGNGSPAGHATNGHAKTNGQARNGTARKTGQDIDGLIRQAEALRSAQRDNLVKTNELLKALKRHRRQSRALQNTIASLRQLKTLGV
jgi:hypothetical protein